MLIEYPPHTAPKRIVQKTPERVVRINPKTKERPLVGMVFPDPVETTFEHAHEVFNHQWLLSKVSPEKDVLSAKVSVVASSPRQKFITRVLQEIKQGGLVLPIDEKDRLFSFYALPVIKAL